MASTISSLEASWENQTKQIEKLNAVLNSISAGGAKSQFDTFKKSISDTGDEIGKFGTVSEQSMQKLQKEIGNLAGDLKNKLPKSASIAIGAMSGLYQGVKNVVALNRSVTGLLGSIASGAFEISAAIAAIPLKIFTGLVDLAASADANMTELRQAIEDIRKEFGDLKGPSSAAVIDVSKNLTNFKDTGLSTWRVFGRLHERLNLVREVATELGAVFDS